MAKKKMLKEVTIEEAIQTPIETPEVKPQTNKKVWTEEELAVLPRDKFLQVESDIRSGKASVEQK